MRLSWVAPFLFVCLSFVLSQAQDRTVSIRKFDMNDGLSQMKTTSIAIDSMGYIWVGTRSGLNRFDGSTITTYYEEDGLLHNRIHDIMVDADGLIYILSFKGLSIFDGSHFQHFENDFLEAEYRLNKDDAGRIWVSRDAQAWLFEKGSFREVSMPNSAVTWDFDLKRILWIDGEAVYEFKDERLTPAKLPNTPYPISKERLVSFPNMHFYPHYLGAILIRDEWRTVDKLVDPQEKNQGPYLLMRNDTINLYQNSLIKITDHQLIRPVDYLVHPNGDFWVACENGFAQIILSPFEHYTYEDASYVWTVHQDVDGNILCGSYGHGMFIKSPTADNFSKLPRELALNGRVPELFHASAARTKSGEIYFAGPSVFKWDGLLSEYARINSFAMDYDDSQNQLIIGGVEGVHVHNLNDDEKILISKDDGLHRNEYIQCLELDQEKQIWAGSYNGLSRIDPDNAQITNYTQEDNTLPFKSVFAIHSDNQGHLWLGGDGGLAWHDSETDAIVPIDIPVLGNNVKSLTDWDQNQLLIGSKTGLYFLNKKKFLTEGLIDIKFYNQSNGYRGLEPGFTGFFQDDEGGVWIPSATSLDRMIPSRVQLDPQPVRAHISKINDEAIPYNFDSVLVLDMGVRDINLDIRLIGTERPSQLGYRYQLDDGDWAEMSQFSPLILNEISPGSHSIRVRANPVLSPRESDYDAELNFKVTTPFYSHPNFPLVVGILLAALMAYLLYLLIRQYYENRRFQKQLNKSKYLESQLLLSELNPHFIFNVLSSIQRKVLLGDRDEAASYIVKLSKMIRNFLNASHRAHGDLNDYKQNNIPIDKEIELIASYLEFEKMKSDDHFDFQIKVEDEISSEWTSIPPMLIQPFVENAIKHGLLLDKLGGLLSIEVGASDQGIKVTIEDDGIGRQAASEKNKNRTGHVSLGTMIIDQRVDLLNQIGYNIHVDTQDRIPKGTTVTVTIKDT